VEHADNPTEDFGQYLRELRRVRRLTLREVEEQSGVSNSYLSQVEHGRIRQPSPHVLQKLAVAYDVPYERLMARAGYIRPGGGLPVTQGQVHEPPAPYIPDEPATALPSAAPGWAFSIPEDLSPEEEVELQNFLQYLRFKRQTRS
jgi:transcriptional regulator with XRE-family HTH domain